MRDDTTVPRPESIYDLAVRWARVNEHFTTAEQRLSDLRKSVDEWRIERNNIEVELRKHLTSTSPPVAQRLFNLKNGTIVMVSATHGVQLVPLETPDATP